MESIIILNQECLDSFQSLGLPVPGHIVDYFFKEGFITNEDYREYWEHPYRMFVPTIQRVEFASLGDDINAKCGRESVIENKNFLLFQAEQMNSLFV